MGVCDEKKRLLSLYEEKTWAYSDAAAELSRLSGKSSEAEYEALLSAVTSARVAASAARKMLENHVAEHGC